MNQKEEKHEHGTKQNGKCLLKGKNFCDVRHQHKECVWNEKIFNYSCFQLFVLPVPSKSWINEQILRSIPSLFIFVTFKKADNLMANKNDICDAETKSNSLIS